MLAHERGVFDELLARLLGTERVVASRDVHQLAEIQKALHSLFSISHELCLYSRRLDDELETLGELLGGEYLTEAPEHGEELLHFYTPRPREARYSAFDIFRENRINI